MTRIITFLLAIVVAGGLIPQGYRGIVPLKSTRDDVERLFGKPTNSRLGIYEFRDEIVSFGYSKYGCKPAPVVPGWPIPPLEGWNVPPDTVLAVRVDLRKQVPLSSLGFDLSTFKKVRGDTDVGSHFKYVDEEAGLTIDLNGDGGTEIVRGYIYEPGAKHKELRCSE
jgi:hypothetical protein